MIGTNKIVVRQPSELLRRRLRLLGRKPGAGSSKVLADLFEGRPLPKRVVGSHRAVVAAVQGGFADLGAGLRFSAAEAGLHFISRRQYHYELCMDSRFLDDPRGHTY